MIDRYDDNNNSITLSLAWLESHPEIKNVVASVQGHKGYMSWILCLGLGIGKEIFGGILKILIRKSIVRKILLLLEI
jgi:hypothetical protein